MFLLQFCLRRSPYDDEALKYIDYDLDIKVFRPASGDTARSKRIQTSFDLDGLSGNEIIVDFGKRTSSPARRKSTTTRIPFNPMSLNDGISKYLLATGSISQ
ncbi:MAG: hypothetical protein MZU97_04005 [Bacillus subtilis]|nr:hypothetical protein [Bacillus subtilis]